jgi:threonine dehydrogenase-like Zn-dependent dehydrogenase
LGHEGIGVVEEVGASVRKFNKCDLVIISCITADGSCKYCKKQMYAHCEDGGWIFKTSMLIGDAKSASQQLITQIKAM